MHRLNISYKQFYVTLNEIWLFESDPNAPSTWSERGGKQWQRSIRGRRNWDVELGPCAVIRHLCSVAFVWETKRPQADNSRSLIDRQVSCCISMSPPPDGVTAQSRWPCGTAIRTYSLYLYNMNNGILSYKYPYIYLLTTLQWNTLNSMQPMDICGNKMVPVRQKDYCRPPGERTKLFTDNDFPSVRYNPWVSCRSVFVTQTLLMFLKMTQYQTHYSITLLTSWDHDSHRLSKTGGSPRVVPSHFGQKITMDLVVPVAAARDSHGSGQLDIMELGTGRQMSQEDISRNLILKLIIYFAPLI